MAELARIRNFCVIAHVDHGKTTLSDRLLETTGTVPLREMRDQMLDSMELEREHGITIKARAVRMSWRECELNLIDTPGHVDFTYEVSRSLAACEGAVLLVDASQGIEAQTLANAYLAVEQGLEVIPVINKIDLPAIDLDVVREDLRSTLGFREEEILYASGKTGQGVEELLHTIVERVPPPKGDVAAPLRAPKAAPQRRLAHLRARDVAGAGLRLPRRLPRSLSPRDRPGAARAGVRHGPGGDLAVRRVPRHHPARRRGGDRQPSDAARS